MDIVLKSLISAGVTAIILLVAKYVSPQIAGAIGGIPIVFAVSYVLLTMDDKAMSRPFLIGGIYGAIAAIVFCGILIWLNLIFGKSHWLNFAIAYVLCFLIAYLLANFLPSK